MECIIIVMIPWADCRVSKQIYFNNYSCTYMECIIIVMIPWADCAQTASKV